LRQEKFADEERLNDSILISSLGKDGTIGNQDLSDLLVNVYKLTDLNEKYKNYILTVKENKSTKEQLVFHYLNILGNDPQLPFPLLPEWWLGNTAFKHFYKISH